jgi:hypothetical protein
MSEEFPRWLQRPDGKWQVYHRPEDVPPPVNPPDLDGDGKPGGRLSKAEIMGDLDRLGIDYDKRWGRDRLDALLREGKPAREAAVNASVE